MRGSGRVDFFTLAIRGNEMSNLQINNKPSMSEAEGGREKRKNLKYKYLGKIKSFEELEMMSCNEIYNFPICGSAKKRVRVLIQEGLDYVEAKRHVIAENFERYLLKQCKDNSENKSDTVNFKTQDKSRKESGSMRKTHAMTKPKIAEHFEHSLAGHSRDFYEYLSKTEKLSMGEAQNGQGKKKNPKYKGFGRITSLEELEMMSDNQIHNFHISGTSKKRVMALIQKGLLYEEAKRRVIAENFKRYLLGQCHDGSANLGMSNFSTQQDRNKSGPGSMRETHLIAKPEIAVHFEHSLAGHSRDNYLSMTEKRNTQEDWTRKGSGFMRGTHPMTKPEGAEHFEHTLSSHSRGYYEYLSKTENPNTQQEWTRKRSESMSNTPSMMKREIAEHFESSVACHSRDYYEDNYEYLSETENLNAQQDRTRKRSWSMSKTPRMMKPENAEHFELSLADNSRDYHKYLLEKEKFYVQDRNRRGPSSMSKTHPMTKLEIAEHFEQCPADRSRDDYIEYLSEDEKLITQHRTRKEFGPMSKTWSVKKREIAEHFERSLAGHSQNYYENNYEYLSKTERINAEQDRTSKESGSISRTSPMLKPEIAEHFEHSVTGHSRDYYEYLLKKEKLDTQQDRIRNRFGSMSKNLSGKKPEIAEHFEFSLAVHSRDHLEDCYEYLPETEKLNTHDSTRKESGSISKTPRMIKPEIAEHFEVSLAANSRYYDEDYYKYLSETEKLNRHDRMRKESRSTSKTPIMMKPGSAVHFEHSLAGHSRDYYEYRSESEKLNTQQYWIRKGLGSMSKTPPITMPKIAEHFVQSSSGQYQEDYEDLWGAKNLSAQQERNRKRPRKVYEHR